MRRAEVKETGGTHFRVLAPDLRGHGRGARSYRGRFELEGCADDVAAMLRALDAGPAIVAGYSMGGPVAQLLWQRHPEAPPPSSQPFTSLAKESIGTKKRVAPPKQTLFELVARERQAGTTESNSQ